MRYLFLSIFILLTVLTGCSDRQTSKAYKPDLKKVLAEIRNPSSKYVLVASHRGDWRNFPENTLEAIDNVIGMGVDIVEIDIAMTSDSVLILMHDRDIDRTTTGKGFVKDITYDSIKNCRMKLQHGVASDYRIPTLEQALVLCKDKIVINIDKGYQYYDMVMRLTEKTGTTDQVLIKGYKKPSVVEHDMSGYEHNMMYMPIIDFRKPNAPEVFELYIAGDAPLAYEVVWDRMSPQVTECMERVLASGAKLWTNSLWASLCGGLDDDRAYMEGAEAIYGEHIRMGATMIQTDRPQLLLDYLRSKGLHD